MNCVGTERCTFRTRPWEGIALTLGAKAERAKNETTAVANIVGGWTCKVIKTGVRLIEREWLIEREKGVRDRDGTKRVKVKMGDGSEE